MGKHLTSPSFFASIEPSPNSGKKMHIKRFRPVTRVILGILLVFQMLIQKTAAQTNYPVPIGPRTVITNGPPTYFRNRSFVPSSPVSSSLGSSPTESTNFIAYQPATNEFSLVYTPDTHGAVGTSFIMTALNTQVRVQ